MENLEMKLDATSAPDFWRDRRVFVTGATGMVGCWLVKDLIARGARVVALIRDPDPQSEFYRSGDFRRTSLIQGQLEDFACLERAVNEHEIDTVFHLAAQPIVSVAHRWPLPTFEANIRGTYNLLEVCRIHSQLVKRVVIASSDKAYGEHATLPYREEMALQGKHPYEVSKSCADLLTQTYHHTYGLPAVILRCGNIYGGGDLNWSRIIPYTIRCFLRGERPVIRSDGKFVRDYVYVKDVSRCYLRAAECLPATEVAGQAFNFSLEAPATVLDIVGVLQKLMQCPHLQPEVLNHAPGEIREQYLNTDKADRILKWRAEYPLERGLVETIDWYRKFLAATPQP